MEASNNNIAVTLVVIGGLLATSSVLLTGILGVSRIEYSMARKKEFPEAFTRQNENTGIPYVAVIATGVAVMTLALTGDIVSVIAIATFSQLFPILGAVACLSLLAMVLFISPAAFLGGILCLIAGSAAYVLKKRASKPNYPS